MSIVELAIREILSDDELLDAVLRYVRAHRYIDAAWLIPYDSMTMARQCARHYLLGVDDGRKI